MRPVVAELGNNNTNDDHADSHDNGANEEHGLAADLVNDQLQQQHRVSKPIMAGRRRNARQLTMAGTVLTMKTTPVTPVASRAVVPPVKPRVMKMLVA